MENHTTSWKFSPEVRERAVPHGVGAPFRACLAVGVEWVDWFNNRRLLEPIGNVPPAETEAAYYASLEEPAAIAA